MTFSVKSLSVLSFECFSSFYLHLCGFVPICSSACDDLTLFILLWRIFFLILHVCLHLFSVWWRQTLSTTARTPWPGQSTPLAAPCVWCSDNPPPPHHPLNLPNHTHTHTHKRTHNLNVKLSWVSIPYFRTFERATEWEVLRVCFLYFLCASCSGEMKNRLCCFRGLGLLFRYLQ